MKIIGVSDVSIGYGSPEVPALMNSVCRLFGTRGLLLEPDETSRPPMPVDKRWAFGIKRIGSNSDDYSRTWTCDYLMKAAQIIDKTKPDLLIVFGGAVFSILLILKKRPRRILYHATEFISAGNPRHLRAHKVKLGDVDLMTAPEVNRLIIDLENIGAAPKKVAPILNCADVSSPNPILKNEASDRNGRFLFYGTLDRKRAFANYFWDPAVAKYPLDIFGRITDQDGDAVINGLQSNANCRYFGVIPPAELNERRRHCSWSLIWWNPKINAGAYFLSPNRFFSSIQARVPPICGPHPQCVEFIKRYDCGLIMKDWSIESLTETLAEASSIAKTPRYAKFIDNCARAAEELNWNSQFARVAPIIQQALAA